MRGVWQLVRIALRNVVRNRRRSAITLVALGMAVCVLVFLRGAVNGLQAVLKERVIYGQTGVVQIHKRGFIANVKKSPLHFGCPAGPAMLAKVRAVEGVQAVTPRVAFATMVSVKDTTLFALGLGIDPVLEYDVCPQRRNDLSPGSTVSGGAADGLGVTTPELRDQLALKRGDELTLLAPDFDGTLNGGLVGVGGFLADNPAFSADKKLIFVPLAAAQALVRLDEQATELAVRSADPDAADALKQRLEAALGPGFEVHTWRELAKFAVDALSTQEKALGFVTGIFALVALFGILNTMLMIVLARTKEIGTMMAVGVRRRSILGLVVSEAAILGGLGAILGGALGVCAVLLAAKVGLSIKPPGATLPDIVRPFVSLAFVARAVIGAMIGAAIAAVYPAYRASRMTPIEALGAL